MKVFWAAAAIGLGLMSTVSAQPWRGDDDDYGPRRGYEYRDRGYRDRDYGDRGYRDRDYGGRRAGGFDEGEYLRCNPDVRRAVQRGQATSGIDHYRMFGRREGRRLSC